MPTTHSGFLIQSAFGRTGNFELVLADPVHRRLAHGWRENDDPGLAWIGPHFFGSGNVRGPSLIQSNFGTPGLGNLKLVVQESNSLAHYWRSDQPPFTWHGPLRFAERHVSGNPAFIQSLFGNRGNFEVVAPRGGKSEDGLVRYWRNNDDAALPWIGPAVFGTGLGQFDAVGLIPSNFGSPGPGHLEIAVRIGNRNAHFWRQDQDPPTWVGPTVFMCEMPAS